MKFKAFFASLIVAVFLSFSVFAQKPPVKKNARPTDDSESPKVKTTRVKGSVVYAYEFEKPEFLVSKILVEHDENGNGEIKFRKRDFDDDITEPLELSPVTIERLKNLWETVNFLESNDTYQSEERDYGHLGTMKLRMKNGKAERAEEFNWTENLDVRVLAEEYRKISTQAVWMFDFEVAKQNQPLRTPRMMTGLDSHLRRNAISDPMQMLVFLKKISNDESVPLIARNHASRLVKRIEKMEEKSEVESPEESSENDN